MTSRDQSVSDSDSAMAWTGEDVSRKINGRWVPAIPLKAPIDVRWCCAHRWTPHVYDSGESAWHFFDCKRCGADVEAASQPENGPWPIRRWIAEHLFPYGRRTRKLRKR